MQVTPELDGGRYPVKRVIGDSGHRRRRSSSRKATTFSAARVLLQGAG